MLEVTLPPPHERPIVEILERTTPAAELIGAVNVLKRDENGLIGENTEGKAAIEVIRDSIDPAGKKVVVLGAGRIARAICVELALCGVEQLTIVNRTESKAVELAELIAEKTNINVTGHGWEEPFSLPEGTDILVQATAISDDDSQAEPNLDSESLSKETLVVDVTIDPPHTRLLRRAERFGCKTIDGPAILVRQAAVNIRLWTGIDVDLNILRESLEEFLEL